MRKLVANVQNKAGKATTAVVVGSAALIGSAGAQSLITAEQATTFQTDWKTAVTLGIPAILGMYGLKIAGDFVMRRLGRAGK